MRKKKRLIGLLLVVALLCTAMVVQLVSASNYDSPTVVLPEFNPYNNADYQLKTATVYVDGVESSHYTYDNTYYNDGSVSTIQTVTRNGSSGSSTWLKKYDEQGRLKSVKIRPNDNPQLYRYYTFVFNDPYDDYKRIVYENGGAKLVYTSYDPGIDGTLSNQWTFNYDGKGRIDTKYMTDEDIWESYTYKEDEQGRIVKKNYTTHHYAYDEDSTGSIDVSYDENGRTETERIDYGSGSLAIYKYCYNSNNQITLDSFKQYSNGEDSEPDYIQETEYGYDEHGNMISSDLRVVNIYQNSTVHTDYTYEYHPRNIVPAEVPASMVAEDTYSQPQTSLNDGDRIDVEMAEPNSGSIKSAGVKEYDDGTQYYFNEIQEPVDASEEQVFSLNFTGLDTDVIDENEPAPAQSYYIYDDNTFSKDHLVASIENGKMKDASAEPINETAVEPANAGDAGKLMMALPLAIEADVTTGYNISVTIPANTLEKDKTYYFVLGSDVVMNDEISKSTNTDMVFKFTTGEKEEHVHTEKTVPGKDATCTEPGLTEGTVCEECGETLVAQEEIPALGHTKADSVKENEVAATCTNEGSYDEVVYCSECGEELSRVTKKIDKLQHSEEVVKGKAATCTEAGLTDGKKCSVCGETLVKQEEIPALGHEYKDGVCTRCGEKDPNYKPEEPATSPKLPWFVNGIVKGTDGKWAMYKKGEVDTSYTGVAKNLFGWWRVKDGYVDFNAYGIYKNEFGWWKTNAGKVTFKETGVYKNTDNNTWWRVVNSRVDFNANGIYKNSNGWWKTTNGKVTFDENGVFKNQYGWWYVKNSKVDFTFTGIASNKNGTWYIKNGKVDFTKNGTVTFDGKTYQVTFGRAKLA